MPAYALEKSTLQGFLVSLGMTEGGGMTNGGGLSFLRISGEA
jgi:hypothetical protein